MQDRVNLKLNCSDLMNYGTIIYVNSRIIYSSIRLTDYREGIQVKYKILLTGNNNSAIDDFFIHMYEKFETMTTSDRYEDVMQHIKYFAPDVFVYCLFDETGDDFNKLPYIKARLSQNKIPFILLGSKNECEEFERIAVNIPDFILYKPLTANLIQEKIIKFLEEWKYGDEDKVAEQPEEVLLEDEEPIIIEDTVYPEQRKHILAIDDNSLMLKVIKEHLHEKYDVATAISGKIAFKFLERKQTDLILLDYEMPDENGPAVLSKLRSNEATKNIPVIFLTSISERDKLQKALVMKPQGYLLKPIERDKLIETIAKHIG